VSFWLGHAFVDTDMCLGTHILQFIKATIPCTHSINGHQLKSIILISNIHTFVESLEQKGLKR
jgi:hypothetical protein